MSIALWLADLRGIPLGPKRGHNTAAMQILELASWPTYPVEGIAATLLIFAAAVSQHFDRNGQRGAAFPLILALAPSMVGLLLTLKAAPIMLSLGTPLATAALQRAFDEFFFWGLYLREAADALAFIATVWAFSRLCGSNRSTEP